MWIRIIFKSQCQSADTYYTLSYILLHCWWHCLQEPPLTFHTAHYFISLYILTITLIPSYHEWSESKAMCHMMPINLWEIGLAGQYRGWNVLFIFIFIYLCIIHQQPDIYRHFTWSKVHGRKSLEQSIITPIEFYKVKVRISEKRICENFRLAVVYL